MAKDKKWSRNQKILFGTLIVGTLGLIVHFVGKKEIHVEGDIGAIGDDANVIIDKRTGVDAYIYGAEVERRTYAEFNLEQIKKERDNAIKRVEILESEGENDDARKALQAFREKGNMSALQELLIKERDKNKDELIARNHEIGAVALTRGDIKTSISATEQVLLLEPNDLTSLIQKGHIFYFQGRLDESEKIYGRIVDIAEKTKNEQIKSVGYGGLGVIYATRGDLDKAEEMHHKALNIDINIGYLLGMSRDYGNLGVIYQSRGDFNNAEEMHNKSLKIDEKMKHFEGMAATYCNLGGIYAKRGELDKAVDNFKISLEIAEKHDLHYVKMADYQNLVLMYGRKRDFVKVREYWVKLFGEPKDFWRTGTEAK